LTSAICWSDFGCPIEGLPPECVPRSPHGFCLLHCRYYKAQRIIISSKLFYQQMRSLLKHKMLQLTLKISLYMAPTCFGPFGPSSGTRRRNLAKGTVFVEIISKNTSLKLLLCSSNTCFSLWCVYWVLCGVCLSHTPHSTQYTQHILPQHSDNFNYVFLLIILQRL
jgi:hypothetical protein